MILNQLNAEDKTLLTDSRFSADPTKSIFFAIKGERHDGHKYIPELFNKGIKEFVVEEDALDHKLKTFLNTSQINAYIVPSSITTLQSLASKNRSKFTYPVVGITGSNGKTIIKEWLSTLLDNYFNIVKSPRSYNSQIGVALSVWEMNEKNNLGIFEAGISKPDEMQKLEKIIRPTLGIFSNIGTAHTEGFQSKQNKIREKLQLFKNSAALIYCKDFSEIEKEIYDYLLPLNPKIQLIAWTFPHDTANISLEFEGESHNLQLPFSDRPSVENAMHCAYAGLFLLKNHEKDHFISNFKFLSPITMRLELKEGREGNYLIDDTYNNDLGGLKMAFNFMSQTHTLRDKVLILSDVFQSGLTLSELANELESLIAPQNLKTLIGIGEDFPKYQLSLPNTEVFLFNTTHDFLQSNLEFHKSLILIKGARVFSFEQIVERFIKRIHGTVLEINLDAITHNLNYYRTKIGKETKLMVMVKALAYGSGNEVTGWLQYHRVDYLAVAYPDEGITLRQNGITLPIMVMNADPDSFTTLFENNLEPEIYSFRVLEAYIKAKKQWETHSTTKIHLKIDSGMHRLGFEEEDLPRLIPILRQNPEIIIASIFSHLAAADTEEDEWFSKKQIAYFTSVSQSILQTLAYKPLLHICNTAGIMRFPEAQFDLVRLGIGLYGVESAGIDNNVLENVATLKTTISQIKYLKKGDTVGYGRRGVLTRDSRIATIAIGYADGFDRGFSGGVGAVTVNNTRCKTIGNVCMDMTMIDVTDADCNEGDEVIIFGRNPNILELARAINTIPYEILTGISERVKRVFFHQ